MKPIDVPIVAADWLDCDTLQIRCPHCRRLHWHRAERAELVALEDAREQERQRLYQNNRQRKLAAKS